MSLVFSLALVGSLLTLVGSALPPLPDSTRTFSASHVFTGVVGRAQEVQVTVDHGTDIQHFASILVDEVKTTANPRAVRKGEEVTVEYRRTHERPRGWAGPQGQNLVMAIGQRVKAFADADYRLLTPNGFDVLTAEDDLADEPPRLLRRHGLEGVVELTRDISSKECHWLEREFQQGQRFRVFSGHTYGTISKAGVAVQDAASERDGPFFELPADALRNVR